MSIALPVARKWNLSPFDRLQYRILRRLWPHAESTETPEPPPGTFRLHLLFGPDVATLFQGKTVIDFGCGRGRESVEVAKLGARRVIGIDIQESWRREAIGNAKAANVLDRCEFVPSTAEQADVILSIDSFEHFDRPDEILLEMGRMLNPGGAILIHFGYTWYHPHGGHLFSVFPWAHLAFSERALCRWRADFKHDGAMRFGEVDGGLNQMTLARFERIVKSSGLRIQSVETIPIRAVRRLHCWWTREFFTSVVRYRLTH